MVLAAVAQSGDALAHASAELKVDREVVLVAVAQDGRALRCASEELQADREVVLAAVAQKGHALYYMYVSAELKADRVVVLVTVAENGGALEHASAELRKDREVVLAAVAQHGRALSNFSWRRMSCGQPTGRRCLPMRPSSDAGGRLAAALQRLAFAACFADAGHFALSGGGPSSACELADSLADVPTDLFESVR